ncbi:MAG: hypothetical protein EBQ80_01100 [Proteobacteria bacterium]|nr:hypothetical protein [Pseudomonadota bacterium]
MKFAKKLTQVATALLLVCGVAFSAPSAMAQKASPSPSPSTTNQSAETILADIKTLASKVAEYHQLIREAKQEILQGKMTLQEGVITVELLDTLGSIYVKESEGLAVWMKNNLKQTSSRMISEISAVLDELNKANQDNRKLLDLVKQKIKSSTPT